MSLVQMQIAIDDDRADLEAAGVRGIDLDYLLDPRIDHRACLAAFQEFAEKELARWREVRAMCTPDQWAWFEVMGERDRLEVKTLDKAVRELRSAFKQRLLKFYKEALVRADAEKARARAEKKKAEGKPDIDWPLAEGNGAA